MLLTRREAMAGYCGGLALLTGLPALAEAAYPSRTIKMIVPYAAILRDAREGALLRMRSEIFTTSQDEV